MTTMMAAMQDLLLVLESSYSNSRWKIQECLKGTHPQALAFDTQNTNRAYCGTFGNGLWKTEDRGQTWDSIANNAFCSSNVMSVSVSPLEFGDLGFNKIYVGTEPSAFYSSNDGGESWHKMEALNNLASSSSWSFPPRPWTHHVRWIESDATNPGYVFVAIEAGALVQSHDGGRTWIDTVDQGPYDTHTLATHKKAPKRLYSSAGDGYFESFDYGKSWNKPMNGLRHHPYLYGLAVDSGDPQSIIVSAALGPWKAHRREAAESLVYRRRSEDDKEDDRWKVVNGLPDLNGTMVSILAANPKIAGEIYALNNRGIFCSSDSGISWRSIDIPLWPKEYLSQHPWALAIGEE